MRVFRIARFSIAILNNCDVMSPGSASDRSSMDAFVVKTRKKKSPYNGGRLFIWGPHGSGKTTWVKENFDYVELEYDNAEDFMERLNPFTWLLIDNEDFDFPDRDYTIYISLCDRNLPSNVHKIEFKPRERTLYGTQDVFIDSKDYIFENISTYRDSYVDMIDKCYGEHGNSMGLIHENLTNSSLNIIGLANVLSSLSEACIVDDKMYSGNWELFQIYNTLAYAYPCSIIKGSIKTNTPASMWTKFLNECMKRKKLKDMGIDHDEIWLLKEYGLIGENPKKLTRSEIDALKFADFYGKLKTKTIQKLKKSL